MVPFPFTVRWAGLAGAPRAFKSGGGGWYEENACRCAARADGDVARDAASRVGKGTYRQNCHLRRRAGEPDRGHRPANPGTSGWAISSMLPAARRRNRQPDSRDMRSPSTSSWGITTYGKSTLPTTTRTLRQGRATFTCPVEERPGIRSVAIIVRDGRDGKWNYASPPWEDLIKPLIARASAARHQGS